MRALSGTHKDTFAFVHWADKDVIGVSIICNEHLVFPECIEYLIVFKLRRHINILMNSGVVAPYMNINLLPYSWNSKQSQNKEERVTLSTTMFESKKGKRRLSAVKMERRE